MEENRNENGIINNENSTEKPEQSTPPVPVVGNSGYTVTPQGGHYDRYTGLPISPEPIAKQNPFETENIGAADAPVSQENSEVGSDDIASVQPATPDFTANRNSISTNTVNANHIAMYNGGYTPYRPNNYDSSTPTSPTPQNSNDKNNREKKRYGAGIVLVASLMAAVIGAVGGIAATTFASKNQEPAPQIITSDSSKENVNITVDKTAESVVEAVAEKASGSVVGIRTTTSVVDFFYGNSESTGEGSGVIYTEDGYIITNYHVIESVVKATSGAKIEVFIGDSDTTSHEATVVGYSISTDLAVLKINVKGLNSIEVGSSDNLKVGQFVVTIGSPGGLDFRGSVTYGVISGLDRVVSGDDNVKLIQTDAAINPGNSGGALLDTTGKLIGINSSKIVSTEYEGMGFAIPVSTVVEKCNKIISKQNEPEPYVGISLSMKYTEEVLRYYGFPNGAVVLSVDENGPAESAGIRRGDIITEFDGKTVESAELLEEMIGECEPGNSVRVKIYRSGRYYSTDIKVISNNIE